MDYGVYDNPDIFFEQHHQTWSILKILLMCIMVEKL